MDEVHAPPQPGSPDRAGQLLPLGSLGVSLLIGGLICLVGTLGFVWLSDQIFAGRFVTIDDELITWLHGIWGPVADQVMLFLTTMGDAIVMGLFVGLATLALWRRGRWIDTIGLVVAAAGSGLLNQLLKAIYERARPELFPGPFRLTSYSFPSGHSMGSIACYGMLAFIGARLLRRRTHRAMLVLLVAFLVFGVGLSRVYFGVHFPTDVLGGFVAGAIWLIICAQAVLVAEWHAARKAATRVRVRD